MYDYKKLHGKECHHDFNYTPDIRHLISYIDYPSPSTKTLAFNFKLSLKEW